MELDLPVRGLDELQPLLAYLIIYLVILVFVRLFFWPTLLAIKRRGAIAKLLGWLALVALRVLLFGMLLIGFLWALAVLGLEEGFYDALASLPNLDLPGGYVIPGVLILLALLLYFVVRPAFGRLRR